MCNHVDLPGGGYAIVCGKNLPKRCDTCGKTSEFLCDFPVAKGRTCDRRCCPEHATAVGTNVHYCTKHLGKRATFGGERG